jgi:hypothetical protein
MMESSASASTVSPNGDVPARVVRQVSGHGWAPFVCDQYLPHTTVEDASGLGGGVAHHPRPANRRGVPVEALSNAIPPAEVEPRIPKAGVRGLTPAD